MSGKIASRNSYFYNHSYMQRFAKFGDGSIVSNKRYTQKCTLSASFRVHLSRKTSPCPVERYFSIGGGVDRNVRAGYGQPIIIGKALRYSIFSDERVNQYYE